MDVRVKRIYTPSINVLKKNLKKVISVEGNRSPNSLNRTSLKFETRREPQKNNKPNNLEDKTELYK